MSYKICLIHQASGNRPEYGIDSDVQLYRIEDSSKGSEGITYSRFIELLSKDDFSEKFSQSIARSGFESLRFETPVLCKKTIHKPFQFALVNSPALARRTANPSMFMEKFLERKNATVEASVNRVQSFWNLSNRSRLISPVPSNLTNERNQKQEDFGHLAGFLRNATIDRTRNLWKLVGKELLVLELSNNQYWLSTAGGGVPWLHVRIDPEPKYYQFHPYKSKNGLTS